MRGLLCSVSFMLFVTCFGQQWQVIDHPNNRRKAIAVDSVLISEYVYSEVSELSEGRAYVAKGDLYAYIDVTGRELTPYIFAEANNFINGYAIVGDSFSKSIMNSRMQLILPFAYVRVYPPQYGLIIVQSHAGTWGVYDTLGLEKLPLIYDLPPIILHKERIIVRRDNAYGVVNDCNDVIWNTAYQYISESGYAYKSGKYIKLF